MSIRLPFALLALAICSAALAADVDPPARVARLSFIQGDVAFQAGDEQAPENAELNRPVTSGDRLMTEASSRAELSLGIAAIRLDERTDLSIDDLDEDIAQIEVNSGTVGVHLRELDNGSTFEIDTPNSTVRLLRPGDYRVDVLSDGTALLAVTHGEAEIDGGGGPVAVRDNEEARLAPSDRYAQVRGLGRSDEFDDWTAERERQLNDVPATRYVSRDVVGYEDLDRYGNWYSDVQYGEVWSPRFVPIGWAPYQFGRWIWVSPWGWTWLDSTPWGFAPFHYGRWAQVRQRWCWVPGPRHRHAVFAPALVAWSGGHAIGGWHSREHRPRGWIPLAPREVYVPEHRASPRYLREVNVSNTLIANNADITNLARDRARDLHHANREIPNTIESPPHRSATPPVRELPPRPNTNRIVRETRDRDNRFDRREVARPAVNAQPTVRETRAVREPPAAHEPRIVREPPAVREAPAVRDRPVVREPVVREAREVRPVYRAAPAREPAPRAAPAPARTSGNDNSRTEARRQDPPQPEPRANANRAERLERNR